MSRTFGDRVWGSDDEDEPRPPEKCRCGGDLPGICPGPSVCPVNAPAALICGRCERDDNNAEDFGGGLILCDDCASVEAERQSERWADPDINGDLRDIMQRRLKETRP
jgi:hypothetical protein